MASILLDRYTVVWLLFLMFCSDESIFIINDIYFFPPPPPHFSFSNLHDSTARKKNFFKYIHPCKNSTNTTWNFAWKASNRETNLMWVTYSYLAYIIASSMILSQILHSFLGQLFLNIPCLCQWGHFTGQWELSSIAQIVLAVKLH